MEGVATKNKLFLLSLAPEVIFFQIDTQGLCELTQGCDANSSLMKCCFKIQVITTMYVYVPMFGHVYIGTYSAEAGITTPPDQWEGW